MKAQNSIGKSDSSQIVTFKTQEEMPGGPPLDVSVEPLSSNSLKMKWRPPDHYLQFGQIKGYYIGYRIISNDVTSISSSTNSRRVQSIDSLSMNEQYAYKNVEANLVETSMNNGAYEIAYLTNLKKHTLYSIVVQAFNTAGAGPRSDEVSLCVCGTKTKKNYLDMTNLIFLFSAFFHFPSISFVICGKKLDHRLFGTQI